MLDKQRIIDAINSKQYLNKISEELALNPQMSEEDFFERYSPNFKFPLLHSMYLNETHDVYRSRIISDSCQVDITKIDTFSYCPRELTKKGKPHLGRLNKSGQAIFYASLHPQTNMFEIKDDLKIGDYVYVSKWSVNKNAKINCYDLYSPNMIHGGKAEAYEITLTDPDLVEGPIGDYLRCVGELCLIDHFKDNRKYYIPALFANHIYNSLSEDGELYEGIIYPSVALGNNNGLTRNFALIPDCVDKKLTFQWVYKTLISEDFKSTVPIEIGFYVHGKIRWFNIDCSSNAEFSNIGQENLSKVNKNTNSSVLDDSLREKIYKEKILYMKENGIPMNILDFCGFLSHIKDNIL